jgi:hypothetical protein
MVDRRSGVSDRQEFAPGDDSMLPFRQFPILRSAIGRFDI